MKKLITLWFLSLVSSVSFADHKCLTSNGYIETGVHAQSDVSFLHTIVHKWKFEFWKGAVCWGRPNDQHQDKQSFDESSRECTGSMNFSTNKDNQLNYTPMTLSWGANLTEGDTFSIHLKDDRVQAAYSEDESECTAHRRGSKMTKASVVYDTKAVINVPDDVWVLQVRAVPQGHGSDLNEIHPRIGREVLKNDSMPEAYLRSLTENEWTYMYVEPGEALDLAFSYSDQSLQASKNFDVRYEFKFIGHNRCVEVLHRPEDASYSTEYLEKIILSDVETEKDFHDYAVKLGCMRSPVFLKSAMNNSRLGSLVPALNAISERTEKLISEAKSPGQINAASYLATILDMTMVDLSRFALNDLLNYCGSYRVFSRETLTSPTVKEVAGVESMMLTYNHVEMVYAQLARKSLDTLVSNLAQWSKEKVTYAQLFDGNADAQTALKAYQQSMVQMGLHIYETIDHVIDQRVPQSAIGLTYRTKLMADLKEAKFTAGQINVKIRQLLVTFGSRSMEPVDVSDIATNVDDLSKLDTTIHDEIKQYFQWFVSSTAGGDNGNRFVETLATLQTDILRPSAENISAIAKLENLQSLDEKFVRRGELNKLNEQINACVSHPYGGAQ